MIERIAQGVRNSGSPGCELFVGLGFACAEAFGDAVGAHGAPFVVVAFEPDFEKILELAIGGDVFRRKVAVVIENRLGRGETVIKTASRFGVEEKIFVNERHRLGPVRYSICWRGAM